MNTAMNSVAACACTTGLDASIVAANLVVLVQCLQTKLRDEVLLAITLSHQRSSNKRIDCSLRQVATLRRYSTAISCEIKAIYLNCAQFYWLRHGRAGLGGGLDVFVPIPYFGSFLLGRGIKPVNQKCNKSCRWQEPEPEHSFPLLYEVATSISPHLTRRIAIGYHPATPQPSRRGQQLQNTVAGICSPEQQAAQSRNTAQVCGFFVRAPSFGGSNGRASALPVKGLRLLPGLQTRSSCLPRFAAGVAVVLRSNWRPIMVESLASLCAIALVLSVVDGKPTTTSLDIARHFGKLHNEVLRRIANLLEQLPTDFTERNFALSEYTDDSGRKLPAYRITRDGFTLLAMGFTGKKALQFKLAYIDAFNRMEAQLTQQPGNLPPFAGHLPGAAQVTAALRSAWAVSGLVQQEVAQAVLDGDKDWMHKRYLISFITDSKKAIPPLVEVLAADTLVLEKNQVINLMANISADAWTEMKNKMAQPKTASVKKLQGAAA